MPVGYYPHGWCPSPQGGGGGDRSVPQAIRHPSPHLRGIPSPPPPPPEAPGTPHAGPAAARHVSFGDATLRSGSMPLPQQQHIPFLPSSDTAVALPAPRPADSLLHEREMVILEKERVLGAMAREARAEHQRAYDTLAAADMARLAAERGKNAEHRSLQFEMVQLKAQLAAAQQEAQDGRDKVSALQALQLRREEEALLRAHGLEAEAMRLRLQLEQEQKKAVELRSISQEALQELQRHEAAEAVLRQQVREGERRKAEMVDRSAQTRTCDFEKVEHLLARVMSLEQALIDKERALERAAESVAEAEARAKAAEAAAAQQQQQQQQHQRIPDSPPPPPPTLKEQSTNTRPAMSCFPTPEQQPLCGSSAHEKLEELSRTASRISGSMAVQRAAMAQIEEAMSEVASHHSGSLPVSQHTSASLARTSLPPAPPATLPIGDMPFASSSAAELSGMCT